MESTGKRIREIRLNLSEKKTTLEDFGKMLTPVANKSLVRKWENDGNLPNKERLEQIAKIGNVSLDYLLLGTVEKDEFQTINKKEIGKRIKNIRINSFEQKLTQQDFANLFSPSVDKSSVRKWENGDNLPNKERLKQIAEIGNTSLPYLYFGISEEDNTNKIKPPQKEELKEDSILDKLAIGKRIKEIRVESFKNKKSLENFGKLLIPEADRSLVSRWEKGVNLPNKERLQQIAEIGNVSIEYLYFGINTKKITEVIREIENNPVSNVGYFITQEQINELKKSINYIE